MLGAPLRDLLASSKPLANGRTRPLRLVGRPGGRESTVLVVGGAGYIGSIFAADLLETGYNVIVLDSMLYGHDSWPRSSGVRGSSSPSRIPATRTSSAACWPNSASVVHFGEIVGDPACDLDPTVTVSVNHAATVRLAALAAQAGIERFIYPSSCSVYGATDEIVDELGPLNPGLALRAGQGRLRAGDPPAADGHVPPDDLPAGDGLRPVARPRFDLVVNTLAGRAAAERRIVVQGGGQWRPFVHVADVASLIAQTLTMPLDAVSGEIFNLGSNSQNYTIAGVAEIVRERVPEVTVDVTEGFDRRNYRVAFDKTARVFGFQPKRTVADGVAEIVRAVENSHVVDIHEARYSNVRALIETDARGRLWRTDLADSVPANPFRPRDVEIQANTPIGPQPLVEEAVS